MQALAGLVEVPAIGIAMYTITKTGKKWLFSATFFATSISCFLAAIFEGKQSMLWLKITFVMIGWFQFNYKMCRNAIKAYNYYFNLGKFTISAGNTIMPTYTAELYPTSIRNIGVGACNVAAGLALILTPALSELVCEFNSIKTKIIFAKLFNCTFYRTQLEVIGL
jgi:MFS transporter, OCT family, solute carrier family 22 (organic cation transporter), member 4/5